MDGRISLDASIGERCGCGDRAAGAGGCSRQCAVGAGGQPGVFAGAVDGVSSASARDTLVTRARRVDFTLASVMKPLVAAGASLVTEPGTRR